jgi:transposase
MAATVVAVDVGKNRAALSVTDADRRRLLGPVDFAMTAPTLAAVLERVCAVLPAAAVKVGIEAAGHYHRPLLGSGVWPAGWQVLELSPARVAEQRRVQGRRRVKTDAIDLEAITELVLAGHGVPIAARAAAVTELGGWAAHRRRRVQTRTATKNQLLAQLDRCFPGLTLALPDVLGTQVGRLVAGEFADPRRLAGLGATRFVRFAAHRGLRVRRSAADRLVAAARNALPSPEAVVARQVLAADLRLLADLDTQILTAETHLARLLPDTPFEPLTTVPGWGTVRAGNYGAAVGDPHRWPGARQLYRASGLSPAQYESAGRRRDGTSAEKAACRCGGR